MKHCLAKALEHQFSCHMTIETTLKTCRVAKAPIHDNNANSFQKKICL